MQPLGRKQRPKLSLIFSNFLIAKLSSSGASFDNEYFSSQKSVKQNQNGNGLIFLDTFPSESLWVLGNLIFLKFSENWKTFQESFRGSFLEANLQINPIPKDSRSNGPCKKLDFLSVRKVCQFWISSKLSKCSSFWTQFYSENVVFLISFPTKRSLKPITVTFLKIRIIINED